MAVCDLIQGVIILLQVLQVYPVLGLLYVVSVIPSISRLYGEVKLCKVQVLCSSVALVCM